MLWAPILDHLVKPDNDYLKPDADDRLQAPI
jgi:hypothetical protein